MTVIHAPEFLQADQPDVSVWRCDGCRSFHVRAGEVLLTFAPSEFAAFAESVAGCYCTELPGAAAIDLHAADDDLQALLSIPDDESSNFRALSHR